MSDQRGRDLIEQAFNQGSSHLPPEAEEIRRKVTIAMEEVILFGGRVRPLLLSGRQVGFIRSLGVHERMWLGRMVPESNDRIVELIRLATTLEVDFIRSLSLAEVKRLLLTISRLNKNDSSLLPWIYPYTSTSSSERLFQIGVRPKESLMLPGGKSMPLVAPNDLFTQWFNLASIRDDSKQSLRETANAVLIVKAMIGKGAQQLTSDIKSAQKMLLPDLADPWSDMGIGVEGFDPEDGWGHIHQDQSLEGLLREYHGMINNDKHEQLMHEFAVLHRERAEREREKVKRLQSRVEGITYRERGLTEEEVRAQDVARRKAEQSRKERIYEESLVLTEAQEENKTRAWDIEL